MRFSKKLVKVGSSLGVIINKPLCSRLNLKKGEWIEIDIKKIVSRN